MLLTILILQFLILAVLTATGIMIYKLINKVSGTVNTVVGIVQWVKQIVDSIKNLFKIDLLDSSKVPTLLHPITGEPL